MTLTATVAATALWSTSAPATTATATTGPPPPPPTPVSSVVPGDTAAADAGRRAEARRARAQRRSHRRAQRRVAHRRAQRRLIARRRTATRAARSAIGSPYVWGATGPRAFDCSGLTRWSLARAGLAIPRTSHAQARRGRPVARGSVRAGDLVFFNTAGPGASHVAIAVSSRLVISATSHGVRTHPIADAYWGSHYIRARRVLSA